MSIPADWWDRPYRPGDREAVEAKERADAERAAKAARAVPRKPGDPLPTFFSHMRWDIETGDEYRCDHPVVSITKGFVYIVQACSGGRVSEKDQKRRARLVRAEVEAGWPLSAWVLTSVGRDVGGVEYFSGWRRQVNLRYPLAGEVPTRREPRRARSRPRARVNEPRVEVVSWDEIQRAKALRVLGFAKMPSAAELKATWREAAKKHHPDAGGDAAKFIAAREAFEHLQKAVAA